MESLKHLSDFSQNLNPHCLAVALDKEGVIQDCLHSPYSNISMIMKSILAINTSIREYFQVPRHKNIDELYQQNPRPIFPDISGVFRFTGEPEEYFSSIPGFYLRLAGFNGRDYHCLVSPAKFLLDLFGTVDRNAYFCIDDNEKLAAFNRHFAHTFCPDPKKRDGLLGKPLSDFILPTPSRIQNEELREFDVLPATEIKPVMSWDFTVPGAEMAGLRSRGVGIAEDSLLWSSDEATQGWLLIDKPFEWDEYDLRLDITVRTCPNGPPCLVLGDPPEANGFFSDRDGYLVGPNATPDALFVKRGGELLDQRACDPQILVPGHYTYCKTGSRFLLYKDGKGIFGYYDNDLLSRNATWLMLFLRQGGKCAISKMALYLFHRATARKSRNIFVNSVLSTGNYYLMSRILRFLVSINGIYYTLFQLKNLSDLKTNMDELEESLRQKERASEKAEQRLKAFTGVESAFIGESRVIRQIREKAEQIATGRATILIEGETGTGKEVLARYIHAMSPVAAGPFIKVDCSTLPATLMESLLFGHEKGAFTGATEDRTGLFEQANRGTLFLDEVSNLPLDVQAKLLQFLQDQTLTPVGGRKAVRVEVRIIVASNIPLKTLVTRGRFREDLYYRIAVFDIRLPPLRERPDDMAALSAFFLRELNTKYGKKIRKLTPAVYQQLYRHGWPGNVRELKNALERAYLFCQGPEIDEINLQPADQDHSPAQALPKRRPMRFLNKSLEEVKEAVYRNSGNMKASATELNVSMRVLYYFLKKNNLDPNVLRKNPRKRRLI